MRNIDFRKFLLTTTCCLACMIVSPVHGADDWRAEFDITCSKTDMAMSLSESELLALISSCDKLEKVIGSLDKTERKVYLKRLQMCKNLYFFVLETKNNEQPAK